MNLRYTLPERELQRIGGEKPIYCVPYDISKTGDICTNGFVTVTKEHLFVLADGEIVHTVALDDTEAIECSPQIDSGILLARSGEEEQLLCRFSMRHIVRFLYIARGATAFCKKDYSEVESREKEVYCPVCSRPLPGTRRCLRCDGGSWWLRRLIDLCRGYFLPLALITLLMLVVSVITIGQQFVQRSFVDDVLLKPETAHGSQIVLFLLAMLAMVLVSLAISILRSYMSARLGTRISMDMRARTFEKINALSLSFVDSRQPGELMNRVVEDSGEIRRFMEEVFGGMFTQLFTILGAMGTMLFLNWKLALLAIACMPLAMIPIRLFRKHEHRIYRQQWRFNDRVNGRLQDVISGIRVVKSFGQEEKEAKRFRDYAQRLKQIARRNEVFYATLYPFVTLIITTGTFFVIYFGGLDVLNGAMTPGTLAQFIAYAGMLYGPLGWLARLPRMLMRLNNSLERIYDILDEESDLPESDQPKEHAIDGRVEFSHVSFGYKSYLPVLSDVSFTVKQGEMIGLVGASGSGKSTMINLLMRLYDADEGQILIDDIPLTAYSRQNLHSQIGVVLQENFLFSGSIYENIRYANRTATPEQVIMAAKMANAHEFITRFPDGYDTYVGEHGYNLSGGERQRIAIARAILHDPRLLILDEATSSLDTETEYQIQEALHRLTENRTVFAIAHRLSTLRETDRILVIDQHRIAEMGTHYELMSQKGIYYGLVMAQLEMNKTRS